MVLTAVKEHEMQESLHLIGGNSETARLVGKMDWDTTPLGPMSEWPQSLKTSLSICLACRFPIILWWGPEMVILYNDDYIPALGKKHPAAMGGIGREVWADVWPVVGPMLAEVVSTGKAVKAEDLLLVMNRNGYEEETYFSFSYSPIMDESGGVGGIFTPVIETTEKVIGHRRIETLRLLGNQPRASDLPGACRAAANVLAGAKADLPFGLFYLIDEKSGTACLAASFGVENFPEIAPQEIALHDKTSFWPLADALASDGVHVAGDLHKRFARLPAGAWSSSVREAILAPIAMPGGDRPIALLVAGVNPHRALDDAYLSFYNLLADQLQGLISEALAYEAERKRVEALAEIDRAKTVFFSNVSHEFRTPLTLMLGPLEELLADDSMPSAAHGQLRLLHRNGMRLLKLVNALLDFSRIEAGRMSAAFEPIDLAQTTAELAGVFRSAIEKAGMVLHVNCAALPQPVYVDRTMWEKIILNLLSNAFKFTFEGAVTVTLHALDDRVVLMVTDTGVGIAKDQLPRVFERFHRIEGTRARTHEGSGIGLALVRDLVGLHGGEIAIRSTPGQGTSLTITLPFGKSHLPQDQVRELPTDRPSAAQADAFMMEAELWLASGSGPKAVSMRAPDAAQADTAAQQRIFVVDDNADMRDYVTRLLQPRWNVHAFADGRQALAAAQAHPPALVIADVMMPMMDGFQMLAALRSEPAIKNVPVILLSARAGEEARVSGLQAGADDYLVKPFSSRELIARVEALLLRSSLRAIETAQARRMETVFAQVPAAIAILRGPEHVYELANPSYLELVGGREIIGKPIRAALPELEGQDIYELLDRVYGTGTPYVGRSLRAEVVKGDPPARQECFFDFVYQPMFADEGSIDGIAVVAFDVTELSMARRAAERASRAKDEFLAMLGHELRNPLAPIMTALQLMKLRGIQVAEKERAIIERQAEHLVGLVDDLMDVARVAQGKIHLRKELVELHAIVANAIEIASPLLEEKRHKLRSDIPSHGMQVHVDPNRFAQILANLLMNAAKYTDGDGTISIHAAQEASGIMIEIADNGNGISPEMLPHIFDMFVQDRQNLARSRGGLGLGLTIVRSLIELHGGSISASSAGPGKGSVFTLRFPAVGMQETEPQLARHAPSAACADADGTASVLIVDDNADAARTLGDLFTARGYRTLVAFDGPSALGRLQSETPDIAILDIGLPGMDGYELASSIRAMPGKERVRLIALTGYGQDSDRKRIAEAGFERHIVKPVNFADLEKMLHDSAARLG
jgi:signal transduction histidine kinase/ActR/RegA family two-component response regulator